MKGRNSFFLLCPDSEKGYVAKTAASKYARTESARSASIGSLKELQEQTKGQLPHSFSSRLIFSTLVSFLCFAHLLYLIQENDGESISPYNSTGVQLNFKACHSQESVRIHVRKYVELTYDVDS